MISGFRANTPGASKDEDSGIIPLLEISPRVGLKEKTPFLKPGIIKLPLVSVPNAASQKPAATAMAISPRVGLKEKTPFLKPGIIKLPLVSVPNAASQKPAATAMAEPALDPPQGQFP